LKPVRIAVAGASGAIGRRHLNYLLENPDTIACATMGRTPSAVAEIPAHTDFNRMLDEAKPDGVIIATPNDLHVPMALACIERGVAALVEKPVADTMASALELVRVAEAGSVPVLVGHHRRHAPMMRCAQDAIRRGDLGRVVSVVGMHLRRKPDSYFNEAWRREEGGGPLLINGIHEIDTMRVLCGEIEELVAVTSNAARGFAVEDTAAITLRFRNGALGTLTISDTVQAAWAWELNNAFLICGTKASLALPTMELCWNERGGGQQDPLLRKRLAVAPADP
jgi:predicted dehydrogenase